MSTYLLLTMGILIIGIVTAQAFKFSNNKSNKLKKFIPSIIFALCIALFYLKMLFVSKGYDAIIDIVFIIFLSIGLGSSLIVALILEFINRRDIS
jgi:4-amino-4-deoxy-L-arabinose transferase-like glycosyltransferase